jgi:hypothetical protein
MYTFEIVFLMEDSPENTWDKHPNKNEIYRKPNENKLPANWFGCDEARST